MIWAACWFGLAAWLLATPGVRVPLDVSTGRKWLPARAVAVLLLGLTLLLLDFPLTWVATSMGVLATTVLLVETWSARTLRSRRTEDVISACQSLSSMVRSGMHPALALTHAADDFEVFRIAASAAGMGAQVGDALRETARQPGYESLSELAAGWELSERTGASLADTAVRIAGRLRGELRSQQKIAAELAGPRATGKLLAALPLVGIALGYVAGGDPVAFLLKTSAGQLASVGAILLTCGGLLWTEWLAKEPVG